MKILLADDQPYILKFVGAALQQQGHEIYFAYNGQEVIDVYDTHRPDLALIDYQMPERSGIEVLAHIRKEKKDTIPVIIMSSNEEEEIIVHAFKLGVDDYVEKPVGIRELVSRVQRQLARAYGYEYLGDPVEAPSGVLQKKYVGIIIPCYNEATRLAGKVFSDFVNLNAGYHLCFVNDGSKDNTLEVLNALEKGNEEKISVYNMPKNGGKAEAVRQGVLHLVKDKHFDFIGYLDADLSTDFKDFNDLVNTIQNSDYKLVSGSRISRIGANITKNGARQLISKVINLIIRKILGMSFQDTQCGAKVMAREVAENVFNDKFITRWLFDVEIFLRMKKFYGKDSVQQLIYEQPLKRWIHADGSKLSMKDSMKIVAQLLKIASYYRTYHLQTKNILPNAKPIQ